MTAEAPALKSSSAVGLSIEEALLLVAILYFVGLKLVFTFVAFPVVDETYYWMWGRHPALSYYDHPPLQGWLQGLSYSVFGRSLFALRWMTWAALAVELWIFYSVARRLAGDAWRPMFLRSTAVFLASPLFGFFGTLAFIDYLLVMLVMSSGYFFMCFFADIEEHGRGRTAHLFIAAVLLGLAALTKYNGAFLGLGVAVTVLVRPALRRLLLDWRLYGAAATALAVQAPVLIWNLQENFASFQYQMGTRHGAAAFRGFNMAATKAVIGEQLILVSAFLVPVIIRFFWATQRNGFERVGKTLAICVFWISSLACLYVANLGWMLFWWNIVAYVLIFPFAGRYTSSVLLGVHIGWGVLVVTFMTITYGIVPVLAILGMRPGMDTERNVDWPAIVERVRDLKARHGVDFIATNATQPASQLAWAFDDPDGVVPLEPERSGYNEWFDFEARTGQTAIVLENPLEDPDWRQYFTTIREVAEEPAEAWGQVLMTYKIYVAEGFRVPR